MIHAKTLNFVIFEDLKHELSSIKSDLSFENNASNSIDNFIFGLNIGNIRKVSIEQDHLKVCHI